MSEDTGSEWPTRLEALVQLRATVYVDCSAGEDALEIRAPFGDVVIPYVCIGEVTKEATGEIRLDAAGGTTVLLDIIDSPDGNAVFALLQQKMMKNPGERRRPLSENGDARERLSPSDR